jgi:hypothetical protein
MWKFIQLSIVLPTVWSNMVYHWTPNGYVPAVLGVIAAAFATHLGSVFWHWRRGLPMPGTYRPSQGRQPPAALSVHRLTGGSWLAWLRGLMAS